MNNVEFSISDVNEISEISTSSYDYTFDEEGFPTSLTFSDSRVEGGIVFNTSFEWE